MPFVYGAQLATAGNLTTNATGNTETETFFCKPGATRSLYLKRLSVGGKNAAQTTLNANAIRVITWGTASTSGTGLAIKPKDPGAQAATFTGSSRPTSGTTRANVGPIVTCGTTSPGLYQASLSEMDDMTMLPAANAGSISGMDVGASASLLLEFDLAMIEA